MPEKITSAVAADLSEIVKAAEVTPDVPEAKDTAVVPTIVKSKESD